MGFTTRCSTMIAYCWGCMLDIIWNAVEDEYLTVIMYLLCSIPMRFSGKTSQMIHNEGNHVGSRTAYLETTHAPGAVEQSREWHTAVCLADRQRLGHRGKDDVGPRAKGGTGGPTPLAPH